MFSARQTLRASTCKAHSQMLRIPRADVRMRRMFSTLHVPTHSRASSTAAAAKRADDAELNTFASTSSTKSASLARSPRSKKTLREHNVKDWLDQPRGLDWYTGKAPLYGACPGVTKEGKMRSLPTPDLNNVTRAKVQEYFDNTWTLYEMLFAGLKGEQAFYRPPVHGLRHPHIFYYGHTACLYVNKLRVAGILKDAINPHIESLCETGVDEMLWDDLNVPKTDWPTVAEVFEYRQQVYAAVCKVIAEHPELEDNNGRNPVKITQDSATWALFMGFEHDRIHLETSSVLFREMPLHHLQVPAEWPQPYHSPVSDASIPVEGEHFPHNPMLPVSAQDVVLGKPKDFPAYGWDLEYGETAIPVAAFEASKHMVTNGEYWHFVKQGGYTDPQYWCTQGWAWRKFRNAKWPFFWSLDGPSGLLRFKLRTIFEVTSMPWDAPVEVNHYEAKAFCNWKSAQMNVSGPAAYRVITEAEHHCIRPEASTPALLKNTGVVDRSMLSEEEQHADALSYANFNLACASTVPVTLARPSATGHTDAMGNAWEWCEDHVDGLDGFKIHPYYTDFSSPTFDGKHHVIMGGSFVSTGNEATAFARYAFRQHFLQHSGFRCVSSTSAAPARLVTEESEVRGQTGGGDNVYETNDMVDMYLDMHFGQSDSNAMLPHDNMPRHAMRFPQRTAELLASLKPSRMGRALDVGCAVGGASFELATHFEQVVGMDFSGAFVLAAQRMKQEASLPYKLSVEAELRDARVAHHEDHVDRDARDRTTFKEGNACTLDPAQLGTFDGILVANLLCRVPDPMACLDGLAACTNQGGVVLLVTPFSWLNEFTPKEQWLGGFYNAEGEPVHSKQRLQKEMEARGFQKIHEEQMPALIREHQRKYQYIISEATGWRKLS